MIFWLAKSCFLKSMKGKENMTSILSKCGKHYEVCTKSLSRCANPLSAGVRSRRVTRGGHICEGRGLQ